MTLRRFLPAISCLILCLAAAVRLAAATGPEKTAADLQKRLNANCPEVSFDGVGFSDAVEFLHDVTGVNLFVDWNGIDSAGVDRNAPVTVKVKNLPFSKVVRLVLDGAQGKNHLDDAVQGNILVIATADALKNQPPPRPSAAKTADNDAVQKALDTPASCDFEKETLRSVLKKLSVYAAVTVDWNALKADGVSPDVVIADLKAITVPPRELLALVLLDAGAGHKPLDFVVRDGGVFITTQAKLDNSQ